jgi:uncharacterized protein YrrD
MPTKLRKIGKRTVVTMKEGRLLGRPLDILVDPEAHKIAFLVLALGEALEATVVVRAENVHTFEGDTLPIESIALLEIAAHDERALALLANGFHMRGQPVLSAAGQQLGRIVSILVNDTGEVTEYRVRKGFLGRFRRALRVSPSSLRTMGGETAVLGTLPLGQEPSNGHGPSETADVQRRE